MARRSRPQPSTWEEARGEFYQEHFPSSQAGLEADDSLSGGASSSQAQLLHILPSRQLLHTVDGVTMSRGQMTRTLGKRRSTLTLRPSQVQADADDEMLPDQDIPDEQQVWDQIQAIKAMPIPMEKKRERKNKLLTSSAFRVQGMQRFHLHRQKFWSHFKDAMVDIFAFELWHDSLRLIEGNFGTGVLSYFRYIKKVMYMNIAVFAAMLSFVVLPNLLLKRTEPLHCDLTDNSTVTACCNQNYTEYVHNNSWGGVTKGFMDFLQGTGYMELTPLFYGYYENVVLIGATSGLYYNLPLAYVLVSISCLLLCLAFVVIHTAHGFQDAILSRGKFYQYCNVIFSAWDFCIDNVSAREYKQMAVYNELKGYLETDQYEAERRNRSQMDVIQLYVVRTVTNIIVTVILIICGVIIFYVVQYSLLHVEMEASGENRSTLLTIYQYLPAMTVSVMNIVVTLFMYHIVTLERYTAQVNVILTLVRTVFLRVASIAVLMYSFFVKYKAQCEGQLTGFECFLPGCRANACWETIIGQTCYKLMLTDFACIAGLNLFVYFPLKVVIDHFQVPWMRKIFLQEFEIPRHVLDVVYNQALCWLGVFYSPLLPGIAALICFLYFYLKRFTCTRICEPPKLSLHTIRSSAFYMLVSLFSFFAALTIIIFSMAEVQPSRSCGPFRGLHTMWMEIQDTVNALPGWLRTFIHFFGSAGFAVPLVVALLLAMYYYSAIAAANKHMIEVLKEQLVLEGHDKQFLLSKLNELTSLTRHRLTERRRNVIGERLMEGVHFAEMGARSSGAGSETVVTHQEL
ncbi:transmembrane channel-like protein 7 [Pollicipes pollicipes]|uniref:transmembrane channel-like protein 7 n=2 Tax=Pollicipes pollicipes TaxID=41117 RepID=UPI001884B89C|nr:transmembrane channel-like protein 7 [Pollicipes pollicipes]